MIFSVRIQCYQSKFGITEYIQSIKDLEANWLSELSFFALTTMTEYPCILFCKTKQIIYLLPGGHFSQDVTKCKCDTKVIKVTDFYYIRQFSGNHTFPMYTDMIAAVSGLSVASCSTWVSI